MQTESLPPLIPTDEMDKGIPGESLLEVFPERDAQVTKKNDSIPIYSMNQINQHNKADSLWIIIDGDVYDVTSFQHEHPGGQKGKSQPTRAAK